MKDSEAYKILQRLVISTNSIEIDRKIEILRVLIEQEDLALFREERGGQEEEKDGTI